MQGLQYIASSAFAGSRADSLLLLIHSLPVANPSRRFVAKALTGGVGTVVQSWEDSAGSGTNLTTANSTAPRLGSVEGVRSVVFNGTSDGLAQSVSLPAPHTLVLVANILTPNAGNATIAGGFNTSGADSAQLLTGVKEIYLNAGSNLRVGVGLNTSGWRVYVVNFNGADTVVNINGTEYTGNAGALGRAIFTLAYQKGAQFSNIAVAEAALYAGAFSAASRKATVDHLRTVYGF